MRALGNLTILNFYNCNFDLINNAVFLEKALINTSADCGATIIGSTFHEYSPQGVTGIIAISESHIALHTWPEHGYATVDVFSCSEHIDIARLQQQLQNIFQASEADFQSIERGILNHQT